MADTDNNPLISSIFWADPTGQGMTYEQLKARRALAAALASKSRDYPTTIGKGIFSLGESIGEGIRDYRLDTEEKRIRAGDREAFEKNKKLLEASPDTATTPPVGPPGPAAAPAPRAELDPDVDLSRAQMAEALMGGMEGSRPALGGTRMASLGGTDTMSDAGQPGMTYGGPSPAGPGASMAERPDQAPPTPSAPPAGMAGPGPAGTPGPGPVAGGGAPPGVDAARAGLAQQIAGANQAFNPDAASPPPGGPIPPQMLAQVGGFGGGGGPGGAVPPPTPPPGGIPPGAMRGGPLPPGAPGNPLPPGGIRPDTSEFAPPTEAEYTRQYGPRAQAPRPWEPGLRDQYNRAMAEALNPDRSDTYRKRFEDAAKRIEAENTRLFSQREGLYKQQVTQEGTQYENLRKEALEKHKERTDPAKIAARDQTIADHQLSLRAGNLPAAEVHKELKTDQDNAKATAQRLEDYQIALDAMKNGVFVGAGANTRLDIAKFTAWVTSNEALSKRAGSTELLKAKLLSTVNSLVKDIKPISNIDIVLGRSQAGDIGMEPSAIDALLRQTVGRSYRDLATYDSKAHSLVNGLNPQLEARYRSPEATWFQKGHLQRLFANPEAAETFNQRYGPGAAEFVLNRKTLNPAAR